MTREEMEKRVEELVQEHWNYIFALLRAHNIHQDHIEIASFHYYEAFKHGYKHCWEDEMNSIEYTCKVPGQIVEYKQ